MHKLSIAAFTVSMLWLGCTEPNEPSLHDFLLDEHIQEMIPLGEEHTWTYTVTHHDVRSNDTSITTETESNYGLGEYMSDQKIKLWDSLTNTWVYAGLGHRFEHDGWRYQGDIPLVYTPYHEGSEKGLLCGLYVFEEQEGRYWFKLPRKPLTPLSFRLKQYHYNQHAGAFDTTWSLRTAFLDTAKYVVKVPAGTFTCYKLLLNFETENAVGGTALSYHKNTIYLTPGVGVVKRDLSSRSVYVNESTQDSSEYSVSMYTYELAKWDFYRWKNN